MSTSITLPEIALLDPPALDRATDALARLLVACVADGAAIGFLAPLGADVARSFWRDTVRPELAAGRRLVLVAHHHDEIVGTVQLLLGMPANQPHRAEIAKMMVHPDARRRGIGRALMQAALAEARSRGRALLTLDTRTGDIAEPLYASVGFAVAGVIPDYALDPDGRARHATTYMYCRL